jgi:hypothetical protein
MISQYQVRRLLISDADIVEECFDSQPRLMLAPKSLEPRQYAATFRNLIMSGCVAYGAFRDDVLAAFSIVWPWPNLPASTLVLTANRPNGMLFNPARSGFSAAQDAALAHMEAEGRTMLIYVRSANPKWTRDKTHKLSGRIGEYHVAPAERIAAGSLSRYDSINRFVLGSSPVHSDALLVTAIRPFADDF